MRPSSRVSRLITDPILSTALATLGDAPPAGRRLLDVGAGDGGRSLYFREMGYLPVALDVDVRALQAASRSGLSSVVAGDAARLPFASSSFDVTVSVSVMQYVDWRLAFAECVRVLRPGGTALFIENLAGNPLARLYRAARRAAGWRALPHQEPREHIRWSDAVSFHPPGGRTSCAAYHLTTPLVLWRTALRHARSGIPMEFGSERLFRVLSKLDEILLGSLPALQSACWLALIRIYKEAQHGKVES